MKEKLLSRIAERKITVGVVGLGYVGLPLAVEKAKAGFRTIGFDVQEEKVENPLKVVPLIHSNLTPVKFSHSPFCLFLFSSYSSCPLCRVLH